MSFEKPTSEVYFMTVPFSRDLKDVVKFSNKETQENKFKNLCTNQNGKHFTNLNIIRIDKPLYIKGDFGDYYKYNYIMFKNPELDNKWWFAFITDSRYTSKGDTEIIFEIDVWQTFQFDITYYQCILERGIVSPNEDVIGKWTASEPVSPSFDIEKDANVFSNLSFKPQMVVTAMSHPTVIVNPESLIPESTISTFEYGGKGSGENSTGVYLYKLNKSTLDTIINAYATATSYQVFDLTTGEQGYTKSIASTNHLSDLTDIHYIPKWCSDGADWGDDKLLDSNTKVNSVDTIHIDNTKLACNYEPKNKKMFTSLGREFRVYNMNGLSYTLFPEKMIAYSYDEEKIIGNQSTQDITVEMRPLGAHYKLIIEDYMNFSDRYIDIPYNFSLKFGINGNSGQALDGKMAMLTAKAVSQTITGATSVLNSGVGIGSSLMSGDASGVVTSITGSGANYANLLSNAFSTAQEMANAREPRVQSIGNGTDNTNINEDFNKLHISELSPNIEECRIIDDYLSAFGYTINELKNIENWLHTRKFWNYIKTIDCNIKVKSSSTFENRLKDMFNSGVRLWHSLENFGDYNKDNRQGV